MNTIIESLSIIVPILYVIIIFFYSYIFFKRIKKLESKITIVITILLGIHLTFIILRGIALENFPLVSKPDVFSFLALMIISFNFIFEKHVDSIATGLFAFIFALLIQIISSIFFKWEYSNILILSNPIFFIHVIFTLLGYTAICISSLYALLYILLNHNIKRHRLGTIYEKLPPLNLLEKMSINSVIIAIILLGIGIVLGHVNAKITIGSYFPMDVKVLFSDLIWISYFTGYFFAQLNKWRGRWMAYLSIIGFIIFIFTNVITIIFSNFHQFGN
jgi:ABC-type uncharacterized transport system permease subunit